MATLKTCFKCNEEKPVESFYKHPMMNDGYLGKCKECAKADVYANRQAKLDYYRQYDRERASQPHRLAKNISVGAAWRAQHPNRRAAQIELGRAVRMGEVAPLPCLMCGEKAEAHHPDYDRPLDVVWLCPSHHKQAHAIVKRN